MFVTVQQIHDTENLIVVDEIGRFLAEIDAADFYAHVIIPNKGFIEDGYTYYKIDRKELELRKLV